MFTTFRSINSDQVRFLERLILKSSFNSRLCAFELQFKEVFILEQVAWYSAFV